MSDSGFYVGYLQRAPGGLARFIALVSGLLLILTAVLAAVLASAQGEPADSDFEYGVVREFTGTLSLDPYPLLQPTDGPPYLVVAPFKHGAKPLLDGFQGPVTLSGSLIHRGELRMIEIQPGSVQMLERPIPQAVESRPAPPEHPVVTLSGEIVDSKCWLGVMKPGHGAVHRACARLCVRGGIPPLLVYLNERGVQNVVLVVDENGRALSEKAVRYIARPIELTGRLDRSAMGGFGTIAVEPESIRIR